MADPASSSTTSTAAATPSPLSSRPPPSQPTSLLQSPDPASSSSSTSLDLSRPPSQQSSRTSANSSTLTSPTTKEGDDEEAPSGKRENETITGEEYDASARRNPRGSESRRDSGATTTAISPGPAVHGEGSCNTPVQTTPQSQVGSRSGIQRALTSLRSVRLFDLRRMHDWISKRQWFGNVIGLTTLVATLVGLLIFGYRSYKLDIYNSHMSYLQVCIAQLQANLTLDPACQKWASQAVPETPYRIIGRAINVTTETYAGIIEKRDWYHTEKASEKTPQESMWWDKYVHWVARMVFARDDIDGGQPWTFIVILTSFVLVMGPLALAVFGTIKVRRRKQARKAQDFPAMAVRNYVQITRHHPREGRAVTSEQGVRLIRHKPEEHHYLGQLRENLRHVLERDPSEERALGDLRRRKWKSVDEGDDDDEEDADTRAGSIKRQPIATWGLGSESTLISGWDDARSGRRLSSVTIQSSMHDDGEDHEHEYEGLIELKTKAGSKNKTFFDPKTGEFIRLTPWKASAALDDDDDDGSKVHGDEKGDTKTALARMGAGAVAFGGGKSLDEEIMEELDRDDILGIRDDYDSAKVPHLAGDALVVTNELPSGKPQLV